MCCSISNYPELLPESPVSASVFVSSPGLNAVAVEATQDAPNYVTIYNTVSVLSVFLNGEQKSAAEEAAAH